MAGIADLKQRLTNTPTKPVASKLPPASTVLPKSNPVLNTALKEDAIYAPKGVDEARELQKKNPTLWEKVSKQLMKPVGLVASATEDLGNTLYAARTGGDVFGELAKIPGNLGGIITGTRENSFSDIWNKYGEEAGIDPRISGTIGFLSDMVADPLNFVGGGLSKAAKLSQKAEALINAGETIDKSSRLWKQMKIFGLTDDLIKLGATKAEQAQQGQRAILRIMAGTRFEKTLVKGTGIYKATEKANLAFKSSRVGQVINKVFNTKTSNEAFNTVKNHFTNLKEYRQGKVMDEALDIQKSIGALPEGDALKVLEVIEKGKKSGLSAIDTIAERLVKNLDEMKKTEKGLGLLETEIQNYFPHIRVKEVVPLKERLARAFGSPRTYSTALGSSKVRKIEGSVGDINKMFGTEFFEQRPAVAFAERALASARAVTNKEFLESVKQFAVNDLPKATRKFAVQDLPDAVEVAAKELKGLKFHPEIAKAIDDYVQVIKPDEVRKAVRAFDSVQNWWKAQALVAPSYHIRNMAGNFWNNFLAGVSDPQAYFRAGKLQTGKAIDFIDDAGRHWTNGTILDAAKRSGVLGRGWYAKDIDIGIGAEMARASWNPLRQNFSLYRGNRAVGEAFENNARLAHFIDKLKKGETIDNAALSVKKYLFDYADLTTIEQQILKRAMPFFTWTRKNIPLQLEHLVKQPAKFAGVVKTANAVSAQVERPNEKYLGDYVKNNIGVRVGTDEKGNTHYFLMGQWLPAAQAIDFLSQPTENLMMMVSPFLMVPIEQWSGQSRYFKNTLGEPQEIERYPEENSSWLGFTMRKKTISILKNIRILNELDKLNPGQIFGDQKSPSIFNKLAPDASIKVPGIGIITPSASQRGKYEPDTTQGGRILQMMFGKTAIYNPATARRYYLWDTDTRVRELTKAIKDARRDGQNSYAKRLNEELKKFRKERR